MKRNTEKGRKIKRKKLGGENEEKRIEKKDEKERERERKKSQVREREEERMPMNTRRAKMDWKGRGPRNPTKKT